MSVRQHACLNKRGLVEDWTWFLLWIPLTIVVVNLIYPLASQNVTALYQTYDLDATITTNAVTGQFRMCDAITQRCDATRISSGQLNPGVKSVLETRRRVGIQFSTTDADQQAACSQNPVACQYNSDEKEHPECVANKRCAYAQLKPIARLKGILLQAKKPVWNQEKNQQDTITIDGVMDS